MTQCRRKPARREARRRSPGHAGPAGGPGGAGAARAVPSRPGRRTRPTRRRPRNRPRHRQPGQTGCAEARANESGGATPGMRRQRAPHKGTSPRPQTAHGDAARRGARTARRRGEPRMLGRGWRAACADQPELQRPHWPPPPHTTSATGGNSARARGSISQPWQPPCKGRHFPGPLPRAAPAPPLRADARLFAYASHSMSPLLKAALTGGDAFLTFGPKPPRDHVRANGYARRQANAAPTPTRRAAGIRPCRRRAARKEPP